MFHSERNKKNKTLYVVVERLDAIKMLFNAFIEDAISQLFFFYPTFADSEFSEARQRIMKVDKRKGFLFFYFHLNPFLLFSL